MDPVFSPEFIEKLARRYRRHKEALIQLRCQICDKIFRKSSRLIRYCRECQANRELAFL